MATALITGASGGIGLELARCFAADGFDVVLVARSEDKLGGLARELSSTGVKALVYAEDLGDPQAPGRLVSRLAADGLAIDALVNNAGLALLAPIATADPEQLHELLEVNVIAPTELTRLLLPGMLERGHGYVLNVASTAAFMPGPSMAAYYASKAYVLSFSIAVNEEVRGSGVSVTALCPGPVATGFADRAGVSGSNLFRSRVASAADVAAFGFRAMKDRRPVAVQGNRNRLIAATARFLPRPFAARLAARAHRIPAT